MRRYALAAAVALAACGGHVAAPEPLPPIAEPAPPVVAAPVAAPPEVAPRPVVPAPQPQQPETPTVPAPAAPVASAPAPIVVVDLPPASPSWADLWREDWAAPRLSGWVRHNPPGCAGQLGDNSILSGPANIPPGAWASIGRVSGVTFASGLLSIDDTQAAGGWALLSEATFDHAKPLRLTGVVDLAPDAGAWLGLTLIQDESDYREIALYESGGSLRVGLWAPCYVQDLAAVPSGPRALALTWHPTDGWAFEVDGVTIHREPIDHAGAALVGRPRVGVYAVNIGAESRRLSSGRLRATVGPLRVSTGGG